MKSAITKYPRGKPVLFCALVVVFLFSIVAPLPVGARSANSHLSADLSQSEYLWGTGADGDLTISGAAFNINTDTKNTARNCPDAIAYSVIGLSASSAQVSPAPLSSCLKPGDEVSPDPMGVDLALAERRVDEIVAVSGNATAQETAFKEYQRIVIDLQKYEGLAVESRIQQALAILEERIKNAGFLPVGTETPIPTNIIQSTQIPVSTQDVLPLPKATLIPSALVPTHIIPTMVSTKIQLPTALSTKIQLPAALPTAIKLPTILPTKIQLPTIIPPLPTLPGLP